MEESTITQANRTLIYMAYSGLLLYCMNATTHAASCVELVAEKAFGATKDAWLEPDKVGISPYCKRIAFPNKDFKIIIDGMEEKSYHEIKYPVVFSPNGKHYHYIARREDRWYLIRDGCEGMDYVKVIAAKYHPDGDRLGYAVEEVPRDCIFYFDGKGSESFDKILGFEFSPDGKRVVVHAEKKKKQFVVEKGRKGKPYDWIVKITFSPDGKKLAHLAKKGHERFLVLNKREQKKHRRIAGNLLCFSPDSRHVAYMAVEPPDSFIVIDRKYGPKFDSVGVAHNFFSPDGKRHAYSAMKGKKWYLVVDGKVSDAGDDNYPHTPLFSPDSKHVVHCYRKGERFFLELVGKILAEEDTISSHFISFSPDSRHLIYGLQRGEKWAMSIGGKVGPFVEDIFVPVTNRGWENIAYVVRTEGGYRVIHNGKEGPVYDDIWHKKVTFSPNGRRMIYGVKKGEKWYMAVNGEEIGPFEGLLSQGAQPTVFVTDEIIRFFACKNKKVVRCEYKFKN